ncbi:rod shape-determining protein [Opitutus terrae]|uniref:Actin/actin family protein n=1 Tax=Opitutus terrae (strain DSM 11246 / JCM 15787 / PB90-1) TaxID=452637 RepID=B1ZZL4_OPITP|nr:rod shape-determining protein [Opitutus terrae]ACB76417.1 actin/actin family protein [Opitutus terrae PB90-1]
MIPASTEKPVPSAAIPANAPNVAVSKPAAPGTRTKTVLVGFDFGTNKSCVLAGTAGATDIAISKIVPTVVGYVKEGIVDGIVAGNRSVLFGDDALQNRLHARLVAPMEHGVIAHPDAARDFVQHLRSLADPSGQAEIRAVVGVPANATEQAREDVRRCAFGIFDRILLIPEPFLAALGYRDDARLGQSNYIDPVVNSLFIDIGGGTSDICLVQGYFPGPDDQISIPFAGDAIDQLLQEELNRTYPNNGLSLHKVREIKEAHGYVGPSRKPLDVKVVIGGKAHTLELGDTLARACNALIDKIYPALTTLIQRASSDSVVTLLQNIIITGGGSQIKGIDTLLQKKLTEDGFESPKVRLAGHDYKRYVALGALKAARAARENQWQVLLG